MHGVPRDLPLKRLHGLTLLAIRPLGNITYFDFGHSEVTEIEIGVEGRWQIRCADRDETIAGDPVPTDPDGAVGLVGCTVTGSRLRAPQSFVLVLDTLNELEVFDSSGEYETFSIPQWNVYV